MAGTLVSTTLCDRGVLTPILGSVAPSTIYAVENGSQGDTEVQYWGTLFQQIDDTTENRYPYEVVQSLQLYRRAYRFTTPAVGGAFVGFVTLWIPKQYVFSTAIIRVFRLS